MPPKLLSRGKLREATPPNFLPEEIKTGLTDCNFQAACVSLYLEKTGKRGRALNTHQVKSVGKTLGAVCVMLGLIYLGKFIFSHDHTPPTAAVVSVAVGLLLLSISKTHR